MAPTIDSGLKTCQRWQLRVWLQFRKNLLFTLRIEVVEQLLAAPILPWNETCSRIASLLAGNQEQGSDLEKIGAAHAIGLEDAFHRSPIAPRDLDDGFALFNAVADNLSFCFTLGFYLGAFSPRYLDGRRRAAL